MDTSPAHEAIPAPVELGLDTFGDITIDADGALLPAATVLRNIVEQGVRADELGLDFFGVGEHHRDDFAVSAPELVLAAIAARTERIRLGSAVTVLSSDDPVRVFERFATLDGLSGGRAEAVLGRGSFTESFPLFGFDLADYETLFEEKLDLFAALRAEQPVTWSGTTRPPLNAQSVFPQTSSGALRTWVGVGGTPASVVRAARYGLPIMIAIIGGPAERFAPFADLHRRALEQYGEPAQPVAIHSPGHVGANDAAAREELWPHYRRNIERIGAERGWPAPSRAQFEAEADAGSLYVGSPETVARRIADAVRALGAARFDLKFANGSMPHAQLMASIERYGAEVMPRVRDILASE